VSRRAYNESLTDRERLFVQEYVKSWDKTKAAQVAGYAKPNESCYRLLRRERVKEAIRLAEKDVSVLFVRERKTAVDTLVDICQNSKNDVARVASAKEILAQSGMSPELTIRLQHENTQDKDSIIELLAETLSKAVQAGQISLDALIPASSTTIDAEYRSKETALPSPE